MHRGSEFKPAKSTLNVGAESFKVLERNVVYVEHFLESVSDLYF